MAAHLTNATYVTENTVQGWEDEFEMLKAAMAPGESGEPSLYPWPSLSCWLSLTKVDLTRFALLVAKQDIQSYYFAHEPGHPGPGLRLHARRALVTARAVISTALALESSPLRLLSHAPSWVVRSIIAAASLLVSALHSTQPPPLDDLVGSAAAVDPHHQPTLLQQHHHPGPTSPPASSTAAQSTASPAPDTTAAAADALMSQCFAALYACSVRDADMPSRCAAIIQPFWSHRSHFPVVASPALSWTSRLSAGTTFWCLVRLQRDLAELHGDGGGQGQASQQQQQQQRQQQEEQQQQQQQQPFAQQKYWNRRRSSGNNHVNHDMLCRHTDIIVLQANWARTRETPCRRLIRSRPPCPTPLALTGPYSWMILTGTVRMLHCSRRHCRGLYTCMSDLHHIDRNFRVDRYACRILTNITAFV